LVIYQNSEKIYQSEVQEVTLNPIWKEFEITVKNKDVDWKISVHDHNKFLPNVLIGDCQFSLSDVIGKKKEIQFDLNYPLSKTKSKKSGTFFIKIDL
jgi:Ca2+-dependent lipid-binding protein